MIGEEDWLFDALIWSVVSYGVEIWKWKERDGMEGLNEKLLKWVLGVERRTPEYLVREELQKGKLRERAEIRARDFKKRLLEDRGSFLARKCLKEVERRGMRDKGLSN